MASGKDAARDALLGRRGGGWIPDGAEVRYDRPCTVCGAPMVTGQTDRHDTCTPPTDEPDAPASLF